MAVHFRGKKDSGLRTNERITASEVRVISSSGIHLGIISIREALNAGPNYQRQDYETALEDDSRSEDYGAEQYEVIEYWGVMDAEYARQVGMELDDSVDDLDEVQINAWMCNGYLLRTVVNPFTPFRIPYHAYKKNGFLY